MEYFTYLGYLSKQTFKNAGSGPLSSCFIFCYSFLVILIAEMNLLRSQGILNLFYISRPKKCSLNVNIPITITFNLYSNTILVLLTFLSEFRMNWTLFSLNVTNVTKIISCLLAIIIFPKSNIINHAGNPKKKKN